MEYLFVLSVPEHKAKRHECGKNWVVCGVCVCVQLKRDKREQSECIIYMSL